jgi:hypothetical protein
MSLRRMHRLRWLAVVITSTIACSEAQLGGSDIVQMADGTYLVSREARTGFARIGKLRTRAMQNAAEHCREAGKSLSVVDVQQSQGPYILGKYPRIDVTFRCVD